MKLFSEVIDSIKQLKGIKHDTEVARLLGMKQRNLTNAKFRNTVPWKELMNFAMNEGIPIESLLTGKGEPGPFETGLDASKLPDEFVLVPQMKGAIEAGPGAYPESEIDLRIAFRRDWIRKKGDPMKMSLIIRA